MKGLVLGVLLKSLPDSMARAECSTSYMSNDSPRPFSRPTASRPGSACAKATTLHGREWRTVGAGAQLLVYRDELLYILLICTAEGEVPCC